MKIRKAHNADLGGIQSLLLANSLPSEDVSMALIEGFLVAEDARGSLVASAGLELLGSSVLLRSPAVSSKWRGKGVARELVTRLEDIARARDQHEVWLLTTTAQRFFERSGYERVSREDAPDEVRMCKEFTILCPSTAVCMRKQSTQCAAPMTERPKTF